MMKVERNLIKDMLSCTICADRAQEGMDINIMRNPDLRDLITGKTTRFSLVTATSKRARDIVDTAIANKDPLAGDKPVSLALDDLMEKRYRIVESDEVQKKN